MAGGLRGDGPCAAARARAGLLDLRVGRRAAAALRALAGDARALAPGRVELVALRGARARGVAVRGDPYAVAVVIDGPPPSPGFADDLGDLCVGLVLAGLPVLAAPVPRTDPARLADALRDAIAIEPRRAGSGGRPGPVAADGVEVPLDPA